ncbi:MAG: hypothetical protein E7052_05285 [Lentisphaerae bacterium]|nr:hypothetical protein [Lentisphaerota bacterium]
MKIATFSANITPPVGTCIAGYGLHDVTVVKHDELMLKGIFFDDNGKKALLISYDLIGMDSEVVCKIRTQCAEIIGGTQADVMLSCTHTHGGPHTRFHHLLNGRDDESTQMVIDRTVEAVKAVKAEDFIEGDWSYYTAHCPVNINRRYVGPENRCKMLFRNCELEPIGDGFKDDELGVLLFQDKQGNPQEVLVNFAAHPLASHSPGIGGHALTADYPGLLRKYLEETIGGHITFVSGAAGDQFPRDAQIGFQSLDNIARPLANESVRAVVNMRANPARFKMPDAHLQTMIKKFTVNVDYCQNPRQLPRYKSNGEYELELQFLSIGDICFVGVPCELLAELGMEIKWHSPFRKAFICYNSTDYIDYILPANALLAGGYEAECQQFDARTGLKLVNAAVEGMFEMKNNQMICDWR